MKKINSTKRNSWINNQIKAHEENKINDSSDFPAVCEIEKNSLYYINSFNIIDNDPTKTNTGLKFLNPSYITWDFEQKTWLIVGLEFNEERRIPMKKIKSTKDDHSTMILLPLIGFVLVLLYSCSQGYFTKKSQLESAIWSDKQDIHNTLYELKINNETLKSDKAKLQRILKQEQIQISTTKSTTK